MYNRRGAGAATRLRLAPMQPRKSGESLLKYDPPVLATSVSRDTRRRMGGQMPSITKQSILKPEDVLNIILPPLEIKSSDPNGPTYLQFVSTDPATRADVIAVQERLDAALEARQARATGLCPVREELFTELFDELLRQVAVSCAERGLLLKRVRDELKLTISAYQTLYESAVAFGIRKTLVAEEDRARLEAQVADLTAENQQLRSSVAELRAELDAVEKREAERRAQQERKHAEELAYLRKSHQQIKTQLESLLQYQ